MKHLKSKNIKFEIVSKGTKKDFQNNIYLKMLDDCVLNHKEEIEEQADFYFFEDFVIR